MKDATISVRLPSALIKELKNIASKYHYVDLSEQIRDIIRQKNRKYLQHPINNVTKENSNNLDLDKDIYREKDDAHKQILISELQNLIEKLSKEL